MSDPTDSPVTTESPSTADPAAPGSGPTRRRVLTTAGLVALVGGGGAAFAACSADDASTPASSSAPSASESSTSEPSATAPSSAASSSEPSASASSEAPSGPSVTTADVPVGGGVVMGDAAYVVTQPEKGTYKAFSKVCTHQGCDVKQVVNKEIVCDCHGSHFSITDGSVISGPAKKPLPEAKTTVSGGKVVIST